jgi:hypothetical protein
MGILFRAKNTQDIVILVHWLSEITSLLLIPPFTGRVSELTFHSGRVRIVAILQDRMN